MIQIDNLNKIFSEANIEMLKAISFIVFEIENNSKNDLFMLSKLIDDKSLDNLVSYYGGTTIRIPTIEQYKRSSILALLFYLTDVKNLTFNKACDVLEAAGYTVEDSRVSLGKKLSGLKKEVATKTLEIIEELKDGQ